MATDMPTPYFGKQTEYYPGSLLSGIDNKTIAQREKSNIFFSSLTWTPPGTLAQSETPEAPPSFGISVNPI